MGKESGGEWIHIHVWLSPSAVHQKLSQHCDIIGYIPIQVKKKKKIWVYKMAEPLIQLPSFRPFLAAGEYGSKKAKIYLPFTLQSGRLDNEQIK